MRKFMNGLMGDHMVKIPQAFDPVIFLEAA
jgi:hypothetical protein